MCVAKIPRGEPKVHAALILSQADLTTFILPLKLRWISALCLLITPLLPSLRKKREMVALGEGA